MLNLLKTHGGKGTRQIFNWIMSEFPINYEKMRYLESHGGGGSILLNKKPSIFEAWNDIDTPTWKVFCDCVNGYLEHSTYLKYQKTTFEIAQNLKNNIPESTREFILRNMSRGGMKKHFAWSDRLRGGKPGDVNAWENKLENLPKIRLRLKDVELHNSDAIDFCRQFNTANTLVYMDPPYLPETRTAKKVYTNELNFQEHCNLLDFLVGEWNGLAIISTYASVLYADKLKGWNRVSKAVKNHAGQTSKKSNRTEVLYKNF